MENGVLKCKNCGASIDLSKAVNGVVECEYCHSIFTVPKKETDPAALSFLRQGEHDLDTCKFDEAFAAYNKAVELDPNEPEAYFGKALAEFKVQYLRDISGEKPRLQPICHEISNKKFSDNPDFMRACLKATDSQRKEYEKKAQEIDYILNEFYKLKQSGLNYDCFICVKVSDNGGGKTEDSKDADYIYRLLKDKGYKPFYSEYEIRNKQGADYEAHILYALYTSECMLIICRDKDYLQTPWVKNEYTRFLKLVNDEEKESDSITFVFYENAIEKLPGRAGKLQGIDFAKRSADGQIVDFVESHTPEARKRRKDAAAAKLREQELQANRLKELEDKLASLQSNPASGNFSYEELAKKMEQERYERERQEKEKAEALAREFQIKNGKLIKYRGKGGDVIIPHSVTSIEDGAFYLGMDSNVSKKITSITIPDSVTSIGNFVFDCENVTSITIPDSVTIIGKGAFAGCKSLTSIKLSNSLSDISEDLLCSCAKLTSITIPEGVTSISEGAFKDCSALTEITIPNKVTFIGYDAFLRCSSLKNVILPNSLKHISKNAFQYCSNLTSIIIPESVTSISEYAFNGCENITIYCRHTKKPKEWDKNWDVLRLGIIFSKRAKVVWGYKG